MKYIILIPTYNPDERLLKLLEMIDKKYEVIVVDDGSVDKEIFKECGCFAKVITYKENKGKGYAIKAGLKYIKDAYRNYVVVTMDDDMQHTLNDAIKLCDYVSENPEELAIGRRHWDKTTPLGSRIGNSIMRRWFKKYTGMSIYDTQNGLRAFSNKLVSYMLRIPGDRYEYEMNVLYNLKKYKINYKEIDIETIYIDNNKTSKFRTIKDSIRICKDIKKWKKENN